MAEVESLYRFNRTGWARVDARTGRSCALLLACSLACATRSEAASVTVFEDGFEPPCYGIANDRPGCIVMPFGTPAITPPVRATPDAGWNRVDVYALVDRSGSMSAENSTIKNNFASVVAAIRCAPLGNGADGNCFDDLWAGAGSFGFSGSGAEAYRNYRDVQPSPNITGMPTTEPGGCCSEITHQALQSTLTGVSGAACSIAGLNARSNCDTSPAGADGTGWACFRADAAPVVALFTDEAPSANFTCPDWSTIVRPDYIALGARVLSAYGSTSSQQAINEFEQFATDTGAIDATQGNAPLVVSGADTTAATAMQNLLLTLRTKTPMAVSATLIDATGDAYGPADFVSRIDAVNDGSGGCPKGATTFDVDEDGHPDTFLSVMPGTRVCFVIVTRPAGTVPANGNLQYYPATFRVLGDGRMTIADRPVVFTVPP